MFGLLLHMFAAQSADGSIFAIDCTLRTFDESTEFCLSQGKTIASFTSAEDVKNIPEVPCGAAYIDAKWQHESPNSRSVMAISSDGWMATDGSEKLGVVCKGNYGDFSSREAMISNGWKDRGPEFRPFIVGSEDRKKYCSGIPDTSYCGEGMIEIQMEIAGTVDISYGSSTIRYPYIYYILQVYQYIDGNPRKRAVMFEPGFESLTFDVDVGDTITFWPGNGVVLNIHSFELQEATNSGFGYHAVDREKSDEGSGMQIVTEYRISSNGKLISWEIFTSRSDSIILQVWRESDSEALSYVLVGYTEVDASVGFNQFDAYIDVQEGDLIGWYCSGAQPIKYDDGGDIVRRAYGFDGLTSPISMTGHSDGWSRSYSIRARIDAEVESDLEADALLVTGIIATSSSEAYSGPAFKAVDGSSNNGVYIRSPSGVCAHTSNRASWIKLDLGSSYQIDRMEFVGRADCCPDQSSGWTIHVGPSGSSSDPVCKSDVDVHGGSVIPIECDSQIIGRYIFITSTKWMVLCEVEVYGKEAECVSREVINYSPGKQITTAYEFGVQDFFFEANIMLTDSSSLGTIFSQTSRFSLYKPSGSSHLAFHDFIISKTIFNSAAVELEENRLYHIRFRRIGLKLFLCIDSLCIMTEHPELYDVTEHPEFRIGSGSFSKDDWKGSITDIKLEYGECATSMPPYTFEVRGKSGNEQIQILTSYDAATYILSTEYQKFNVTDSQFTINFLNNGPSRDVYFQSDFDSEITYTIGQLDGWNCGMEDENENCQMVRDGWFFWGSAYAIELSIPHENFGYDAIDRAKTDTGSGMQIITEYRISSNGKLISWEIFTFRSDSIILQVWRESDSEALSFVLVGSTEVDASVGFNQFDADIDVQEGDFIGWYCSGVQPIKFDDGGYIVRRAKAYEFDGSPSPISMAGHSDGWSRSYSIRAGIDVEAESVHISNKQTYIDDLSGWSKPTSMCGDKKIVGGYDAIHGGEISKSFYFDGNACRAQVQLDYYGIDTDHNYPTVLVDGNEIRYKSYALSYDSDICGKSGNNDQIHRIEFTAIVEVDSFLLTVVSNSYSEDSHFGINNIQITLTCPELHFTHVDAGCISESFDLGLLQGQYDLITDYSIHFKTMKRQLDTREIQRAKLGGVNILDSYSRCSEITVTYDGSSKTVYCDGHLETESSGSIILQNSMLDVFSGQDVCVTEVRLWDFVLTDTEISHLPQLFDGYCIHENDPFDDEVEESIFLEVTEEECWEICGQDDMVRACTYHLEPDTCITYVADDSNFVGSNDTESKCYIPRHGVVKDTSSNLLFKYERGQIDDQTGVRDCIRRHDFDIQRTLGNGAHTVYAEFYFGANSNDILENDELILNLGQEFPGAHRWIYGQDRKLYIGAADGKTVKIDEQECREKNPNDTGEDPLLITAVYDNGNLNVYCKDQLMITESVDLLITRSALALGQLSYDDSNFEPLDERGCISRVLVWDKALNQDEIADISFQTVFRPTRFPSSTPSIAPTTTMDDIFNYECTFESRSENVGRPLGIHEFTINMQIDLQNKSLPLEENSGYALVLGSKDEKGSIFWKWDTEKERHLVFGIVGSTSDFISVDVWNCQYITMTHLDSYLQVYCDHRLKRELYGISDLDIKSDSLLIAGHIFGRCITQVHIQSNALNAEQLQQNYKTTTTMRPSRMPSMTPNPGLFASRIFDLSYHDERVLTDCIVEPQDIEVMFNVGVTYTIHVQTRRTTKESFERQQIFSLNGQLSWEWNEEENTFLIVDANNQVISSTTHEGLLCEHLTTSFKVVKDGFADITVHCESQKLNLQPHNRLVNFNIKEEPRIQLRQYSNFCTQEIEMWERELYDNEIETLAVFPAFQVEIGECSRVCGPGIKIQRVMDCTSYYWKCDHLVASGTSPIPCNNGDCQALSEQRDFTLTNGVTVNSTACILEEMDCIESDIDACAAFTASQCVRNDNCTGFSISEMNGWKMYNDTNCMTENTINDPMTSVFVKAAHECNDRNIDLFLASLRLLPLGEVENLALGEWFDVTLYLGPFEPFNVQVKIACPNEAFAMGIRFQDPPKIGNVLSINELEYSPENNGTLLAVITLHFGDQSMQFSGSVSASEFKLNAISDGGLEIVNGIVVNKLGLTLSRNLIRAEGMFDFYGIEASTEIMYENKNGSSSWSISASTNGTVTIGDVIEIDSLAFMFEKTGNIWNVSAELGESRINIGDKTIALRGDIKYMSGSGDYRISAELTGEDVIKFYGFSITGVSILYESAASQALTCGGSTNSTIAATTLMNSRSMNATSNSTFMNATSMNATAMNVIAMNATSMNATAMNVTAMNATATNATNGNTTSSGFLVQVNGIFQYEFSEDNILRIKTTFAYHNGVWLASGYLVGNAVRIFDDLYLTKGSICTLHSSKATKVQLSAGVEWHYDEGQIFQAEGALNYDGKFFDGCLKLAGLDGFKLPSPMDEFFLQEASIGYNQRDNKVSANVSVSIKDVDWKFGVDLSNSSSGFHIEVVSGTLLNMLNAFGDVGKKFPSNIRKFLRKTDVAGFLSYDTQDGFLGDVTFTYRSDGKASALSFWFKYKDSSKYAALIRLASASDLGSNAESIANLGGDGSNIFMIAYSVYKQDQIVTKLGDQMFGSGIIIKEGFSAQIHIDARKPIDRPDTRNGILRFIDERLKIREITVTAAISGGSSEAEFSVLIKPEWKIWEFLINHVELKLTVAPAKVEVSLSVKAICYLVKPSIDIDGAISFAYKNGQFEFGIGLGFTGEIKNAFGVDGLILRDVQFDGRIATIPGPPGIQPAGLHLRGEMCNPNMKCIRGIVFFSATASQPAFYAAISGNDWVLADFLDWRAKRAKNRNLLNQIGFKSFDLEIGASTPSGGNQVAKNTQFTRIDGSPITRLDGSALTLKNPFFRVDIRNFNFGIISGRRFLIDIDLSTNPKLKVDLDLNELNLGAFRIRDDQCRPRTGPRMALEAWRGHFKMEAAGSVSIWKNCIGIYAKIDRSYIEGCVTLDLRIRIPYPVCKCKWRRWKLKCRCEKRYKRVGFYERLCGKVKLSSGGRRALSSDEDWMPKTEDMTSELWELREQIAIRHGARVKVFVHFDPSFNGIYADETAETFDGFPVYRRLDNEDMILFRQCRHPEDETFCELNHPWILTNKGILNHELEPDYQSDPEMNFQVEQDRPWKVFWNQVQVQWMSNFGSTEIGFRDEGVFKYQGEQRNGAPLYRMLEDPMTILYLGDDEGDELTGVSDRWVVAKFYEVGYGEVLVPQIISDVVQDGQGPLKAHWPGYEDDFRHSIHSHVWRTDLTEVPHDQWKPAIYISGSENNQAFSYFGEAWNQTKRFESDGSRIEPGYYKYPIQAIKISMNGVDRYFKLYLGEEDYRWPGYAGYTLKDLLETEIAQNSNDGVFYEHTSEETIDLWSLFETNNKTNSSINYPTIAPTNRGYWPEHGKYCVNGGVSPVLDVNVNSDHENIFGRIVIRRGPNEDGKCGSYEGIGLDNNVTAGFHDEYGNHMLKSAYVYVLPLPASCSSFCPSGFHLAQDEREYWICKPDYEDEVYCDCFTYFKEGKCEACPANYWIGDAHHRLTQCSPERCINECEEGQHLSMVKVENKCKLHEDDQIKVNLNDTCFADTGYTLELECVEDDGSYICDCDSYFQDERCHPCPPGTWVGNSAHTLNDSYCLPKRLGEVPEIPSYNFDKGYVAEDRPNILEILEQTTHEGFLDNYYFEDKIDLAGAYATNLFRLTPLDDSTYKAKAKLIGDVLSPIRSLEYTSEHRQEFDIYMSYYSKEKEVGYLAQQVDILVERCVLHQLHCFVLNLVHEEMLASFYQLKELHNFMVRNREAFLLRDDSVTTLARVLEENGVTPEDIAEYHKENAKLVVQRAQQYVEIDIQNAISELRTNVSAADDPRVVVRELEIPSSSFMDTERTEYYPISGILTFLGQNFTIDTQRKFGRDAEDFKKSTDAMLADVRRDIAVQWIVRHFSDHNEDCDAEPVFRYLTRENYEETDNAPWQSLLEGDSIPSYDRERIYACSKSPRIQAYRYKSMWKVWNHKEQEYLKVGRANADWELSKQQLASELFLNEEKTNFLTAISTQIELSDHESCASDGNLPSNERGCCEGLVVNPETSMCEVACAKKGTSPWINGSLMKCCDPLDKTMMEGDKYFCGSEHCVREGQEYTKRTPCCENLVEGDIDGRKVCVMEPGMNRKIKSTPKLENYRRIYNAPPGLRRVRRNFASASLDEHTVSSSIHVFEDSSPRSWGGFTQGMNEWEGYFCPNEVGRYKFNTICNLAECDLSIDGIQLSNETKYWDSKNPSDCVKISIIHTWSQPNNMLFIYSLPQCDDWSDDLTTGLFFQTQPKNGTEGYCRGLGQRPLESYSYRNPYIFEDKRLFYRSMDLFGTSMEHCRDQCDRDKHCVGFSITKESFAFPHRCLIHTENINTVPSFGWTAVTHVSNKDTESTIVLHSGDEGVECYSKTNNHRGVDYTFELRGKTGNEQVQIITSYDDVTYTLSTKFNEFSVTEDLFTIIVLDQLNGDSNSVFFRSDLGSNIYHQNEIQDGIFEFIGLYTVQLVVPVRSKTCNLPDSQEGYIIAPDASISSCTFENCKSPLLSGVTCESGYDADSRISATGCKDLNDFITLTGCTASKDLVEENASGVGTWGGYCTCPSGRSYPVGDKDYCGSLACIGGASSDCNKRRGSWSGRKVTCKQSLAQSSEFVMSENGDVFCGDSRNRLANLGEMDVSECAQRCAETPGCYLIEMDCDGRCSLLPECLQPTVSRCGAKTYNVRRKINNQVTLANAVNYTDDLHGWGLEFSNCGNSDHIIIPKQSYPPNHRRKTFDLPHTGCLVEGTLDIYYLFFTGLALRTDVTLNGKDPLNGYRLPIPSEDRCERIDDNWRLQRIQFSEKVDGNFLTLSVGWRSFASSHALDDRRFSFNNVHIRPICSDLYDLNRGQRLLEGEAIFPEVYRSSDTNDKGLDCMQQCRNEYTCDAWEFRKWENRYQCALWMKTSSSRWTSDPNIIISGETDTLVNGETYVDNLERWGIQTSTCGDETIVGGYNAAASGDTASKTFNLQYPGCEVDVQLDYYKIDSWDQEAAIVKFNEEIVWSEIFGPRKGKSNSCGRPDFKEFSRRVRFTRTVSGLTFTLSVTSDLDQSADDESFGFNNVQITPNCRKRSDWYTGTCASQGISQHHFQDKTEFFVQDQNHCLKECEKNYRICAAAEFNVFTGECYHYGTSVGVIDSGDCSNTGWRCFTRHMSSWPLECQDIEGFGYDAVDRARTDRGSGMQIVTEYRISSSGKLISWEIFTSRSDSIILQVWRESDSEALSFVLVGYTEVDASVGFNQFDADIDVQEGDFIGWYCSGVQPIKFDDGGDIVRRARAYKFDGLPSTISMAGHSDGWSRSYSIRAGIDVAAESGSFTFDLKGQKPEEIVHMNDGLTSRRVILSQQWATFATSSRYLEISFENVDGQGGIEFRSTHQTEIQRQEDWFDWNCGQVKSPNLQENNFCQDVRTGNFLEGGDYQITFNDRE